MANVYDKLKEMNLTLPTPPAKGGLYTPVMEFGDHLLYCSGCGPQINGTSIDGKLGKDLTVEQGQEAALRCMLNLLANLDAKLGDLNRIKRFVKVLAFVNSADDFTQQPQVVNGGSQLLLDLFGEERGPAGAHRDGRQRHAGRHRRGNRAAGRVRISGLRQFTIC